MLITINSKDEKAFTLKVPNKVLLNNIVTNYILKKSTVDIDPKIIKNLLFNLNKYIKNHPNFELVNIETEDESIIISL